MRLDYHIL